MMFRDPEFRLGFNNVTRYGSNGTVTRIARPSDCPTTSTHCLQIQTTAVSSPGLGGFIKPFNPGPTASLYKSSSPNFRWDIPLAVHRTAWGPDMWTNS